MDGIWKNIRMANEYQLEELMNWPVNLQHLQAVLKKIDSTTAFSEDHLIYHFWDRVKPSIHAKWINKTEI